MRRLGSYCGIVCWLASGTLAGLARAGTPALPIIPAYITNVTQAPYHAHGDGTNDDTTAIQSAINDVSSRGGGTVQVPGPGVYLSGPLTLKSKINLQIDAGATLRMKPYTNWSGSTPLLTASSLSSVELSGAGGIDGQGAGWWPTSAGSGLYMIYFNNCNTVLVQGVTVSNAPKQQVVFKGKCGNITVQGVTIRAPSSHGVFPSHNTDGIDLLGTNCVVRDCDISTGDDNIAIGSSGGVSADILVTNCSFGDGHGMTIGSNTAAGVSNLTVINCTFNRTDNGIRMKSDNDRGGVAQNLSYFNLSMTNLGYAAIAIHSYYNWDSDPTGASAAKAASTNAAPVTSTTPIWRNILISNLTATVASGGQAGIVWGRTEMPVSNLLLCRLNITAPANFDLYNVYGAQFVDSRITLAGTGKTFSLYNAGLALTNSGPATNVLSMDGLAGTNSLALYNTRGAMSDSTLLGANPITLSASTLSNSIGVGLSAATVVNFVLGTNTAAVAVSGDLALDGTLNITNGAGFGPGSYALFTYTSSLSGSPVLGTKPPGYDYSLDTNTAKLVNLKVMPTHATATLSAAAMSSDGQFRCSVTGVPGLNYGIQASTNLSDWSWLLTNAAPFTFTDTNAPPYTNRFYRAVYLP